MKKITKHLLGWLLIVTLFPTNFGTGSCIYASTTEGGTLNTKVRKEASKNYDTSDQVPNTSALFAGGNGTKETPYQISNFEQFEAMRGNTTREYGPGKITYYELTADIIYNKDYKNYKKWAKNAPKNKVRRPVDSYGNDISFAYSHLDGKGHTVYGIYAVNESLFWYGEETTITNIQFSHFYIKNTPLLFINLYQGMAENIIANNGIILYDAKNKQTTYGNGGLFTLLTNSPAKNITANVEMNTINENYIGIIAADAYKIQNCTTSGKLTVTVNNKNSTNKDSYFSYIGGIIGGGNSLELKNCKNNANIKVSLPSSAKTFIDIGGIVGSATTMPNQDGTKKSSKITGCTNNGKITVTTKYNLNVAKKGKTCRQSYRVAGIVPQLTDSSISDCVNSGTIKAAYAESVSGIVGNCKGNVTNCLNTADLTTIACSGTAGICNTLEGNLSHCENRGNLKSTEKLVDKQTFFVSAYITGIVGRVGSSDKNCTVSYCKNIGTISYVDSSQWTSGSGIVNHLEQCEKKKYHCTLTDCYNSGTIEGSEISGIVSGSGSSKQLQRKGHNYIKNCVNAGILKQSYDDDRAAGIIFMSYYTDITNCYNIGKVKLAVKNSKYTYNRLGQLVSLNNEGSKVKQCHILTSKENKFPGTAINQNGGTTSTVSRKSSAQIKKIASVQKIIKNAGIH